MTDKLDKYGNREDELRFCCFPDCGCDGVRLCMAEEGPSWISTQVNLEKRSTSKPLVYELLPSPLATAEQRLVSATTRKEGQ